MTKILALVMLAARRATATPGLLAIRLVGVLVAVTLVAGVSLFSTAMGDAMLQARLRVDPSNATIAVSLTGQPLTDAGYDTLDGYVRDRESADLALPLGNLYVHHSTATVAVYHIGDRGARLQGAAAGLLSLDYYEGLAAQIRILSGSFDDQARLPDGDVPVLLSRTTEQRLHLHLGSRLGFSDGGYPPTLIGPTLVVAGIFLARDPGSLFWGGNAGNATSSSLVTPRLGTFQLFAAHGPIFSPAYFWMQQTTISAVHLADADTLLSSIARVQGHVASLAPGTSLITPLDLNIQGFLYQYNLLPYILLILVAPIVALILYAVAVTTALVLGRQAGEIVLMRSRGATGGQVMALYLCEGIVLAGVGILLGPLLGLLVARLIGHASGFLSFTGGLPFNVQLTAQTYLYVGITALLCLLAALLPAMDAARFSMTAFKGEQARRRRRPLWQRFFLDLIALLIALYGFTVLVRQGPVTSGAATAAVAQDPLIAAAPLLFAVAVTLLLSRALPWLAALGLPLCRRFPSPAAYVALQGVSRAPRQPMRLVQLCTLTLALGICAAAVAGVESRNQADQQMYAAGAPVRLSESFDRASTSALSRNAPDSMPLSAHLALPGVHAATPALRYESVGNLINTTDDGTIVNVLGVDPTTAGSVMWFRPDFADLPFAQLLKSIAAPGPNAIVSDSFLQATGLHRGDRFAVTLTTGARVSFRIASVAHYFPSLDPRENPFVVTNLTYLARLGHGHGPNEVWLSTDRDPVVIRHLLAVAHTWPRQILSSVGLVPAASVGDDPLTSGMYGVVSVGFLTAIGLALLGLIAYAYLVLQQRLPEVAIIRALGLSKGQVRVLLILEEVFLLGAAVLNGLIVGLLTTQLFLPYLPIATNVVPPFVIVMPWGAIGAFVAAIFLVFFLCLSIHVSLLLRMQLGRVLRLGEG
jgi:putative ABC transport system permease protein